MKVKRTSIADLIRPLREAKEREREKGRGARSMDDANISNDATVTEGIAAVGERLAAGMMAPAKTLPTMTPPSETTPSYPTITTSLDLTNLGEEAPPALPDHTPSPVVTPPLTEQEKLGGTSFEERRLRVTKRSLREGKSQSLILLTGLEPEDKEDAHSKKHASESTSSFEQRLQVMLHRMGVVKTPPADTKTSQNKDEELRKANSEGTILEKPEPPPTYLKPRTMSTSSADPRHPIKALDPIRPEPPLHPKPPLSERPVGPLPPKPAIAAKPPIPTPAAPAGGEARPSSAPTSSSSAERIQLRTESTAQNGSQEGPRAAAPALSPRKELLPPATSPWRGPTAQGRSEKAQSVTDDSLPKPRQHMKPLPQRRAVSVHEDALTMTQELKAVLQRSPIRFRGNRGDLPTCAEDPSCGEEAQKSQEASDTGKLEEQREAVQKDAGLFSEPKQTPPPVKEKSPGFVCPSSPAQAQNEASSKLFSPSAILSKAPSIPERPPAQTQTLEKPPVTPTSQKKSPCTSPAFHQTLEKLLVSPPPQEKTPSTSPAASDPVEVSPQSHREKSPDTPSTQERAEAVSKQHTVKAEHADQRTEPPPPEKHSD